VDNIVTGTLANVMHLVERPGFEYRLEDVSRPLTVKGEVDWVLHLASPASPIDFPLIPIEILEVGALGTRNLLGLAKAKGARFALASTSEVYGDPLVHPQPESYWGNVNPIGPRSCYDEAKRFAEAFTMAYHRVYGLDTRIFRIFNTYGPRMRPDDGRSVPTFIRQALAGEPLTVQGDGSQTRSFCYVDDLVSGILAVMERGDNQPFNLGSEYEVSMLELAETVRRLAGSQSSIEFGPLPQDDPKRRRPDLTRTRRVLGWEPVVGIEPGLARTLEYFRGRP
jgi:dTDP-glucose 4,6-dehydratase